MDPYEILGVSRNASAIEIRNAYRKLAKRFHPDVNKHPEALEMTSRLNAAYDILSDPDKKFKFDNRFFDFENVIVEEDPREVYRREFKKRKIEEARRRAQAIRGREARVYKFTRLSCYPIAVFAFLIIIDYFLPVRTEVDYPIRGYQVTYSSGRNSSGGVDSYMEFADYTVKVPPNVHIDYDYFAEEKKLVFLEFTPIFKTFKRVGVDQGEYRVMYRSEEMIYSIIFIPVPYMLIVISLVFIEKKAYTRNRYSLSFMPIVIACILVLLL